MKKLSYATVGDNYDTKDPIKLLAQKAAQETAVNLSSHGFSEFSQTRGESAFVWKQGTTLMASVIEGLGTKSLIADNIWKDEKKSFYHAIAYDTVATIINDLVSVGARPLVLHAFWSFAHNSFFEDKKRIEDLIEGWQEGSNDAGVTWGGGESPTLQGILKENTIDLGGSAVGYIKRKKELLLDTNVKGGDSIILIQSTGINANGVSLARAIAAKLPKGYQTKVTVNTTFGQMLLRKSNIYAKVVAALFDNGIALHYISHITGHGLRKIMRGKVPWTYVIEKVCEIPLLFAFIQKKANLSEKEMYETYNMGMDYALFLPQASVKKALTVISSMGFIAFEAGYVEKGKKQLIMESKNIVFEGDSLQVRT